jgi:hypothetical protein
MDTIQGCSLGPTQVLSYQAPASKLNNNVQKIYTELLLSPQSLLILNFISLADLILYYVLSSGGNARDAVTGFDRFMIEREYDTGYSQKRVIRRLAFHSWRGKIKHACTWWMRIAAVRKLSERMAHTNSSHWKTPSPASQLFETCWTKAISRERFPHKLEMLASVKTEEINGKKGAVNYSIH